jgi:hypothetical protein
VANWGPLGSRHEAEVFPWIYEYHYDSPLPIAGLPSRIYTYYTNEKGERDGISTFRILSLSTAPNRLPESAFQLPAGVLSNVFVHASVSNEFLVYDVKDGRKYKVLDQPGFIAARSNAQKAYYAFALLGLLLPGIFLGVYLRESKQREMIQQTKT